MAQLIGIFGPTGSGKTHFIEQLLDHFSASNISCRGVYCPAIFEHDLKTGIQACLIPSGETRILARLAVEGDENVFGKWRMFPQTLAWALAYLQEEQPSDIWIIDELGPYEVEQGLGWAALLPKLERLPARVTVFTFRPVLLDYFTSIFPRLLAYNLEIEGTKECAIQQIDLLV